MAEVSRFRQVAVGPLAPMLVGYDAVAQQRWAAWRRRQLLADRTPESFGELIAQVLDFADPVLSGTVTTGTWDVVGQTWVQP